MKLLVACLAAQAAFCYDPGKELNENIARETDGKLSLTFEFRSRFEYREGEAFGLKPNQFADFIRTRIGVNYKPASWIRLVALGQDARAPLLGKPAPGSMRDPFDLQESYAEFRPDSKEGFGSIVGRQMLQYGDTRLIGAPQWAYTARTYDNARVYWRKNRTRLEALFISPIKTDGTGFNQPVLGDRIWGTYSVFGLPRKLSADVFALRHDQNRPGGYMGVGTLRTNTFGTRIFGPITKLLRFDSYAVFQNGKIGNLPHRAHAWLALLGRTWTIPFGDTIDLSVEYKYASGTNRADRSGTFDQLQPAAHDKLGHADVLGWRNVRNIRAVGTWTPAKNLNIIAMYDNSWLASRTDAVYNAQGAAVVRSPLGTAGSHIGQEADLYMTYKLQGLGFGAGVGRFFNGEFIKNTTPGASPLLLYVFQSYNF